MLYDEYLNNFYTSVGAFVFEGQPLSSNEQNLFMAVVISLMAILNIKFLFMELDKNAILQVLKIVAVTVCGFIIIAIPKNYMKTVFRPCVVTETVELQNGTVEVYTCQKIETGAQFYMQTAFVPKK